MGHINHNTTDKILNVRKNVNTLMRKYTLKHRITHENNRNVL
jgi:hypothetical protein